MMKNRLRILHLEDNPGDAELIASTLESRGSVLQITRVDNRADFQRALDLGNFDLILSDFSLPAFDGLSALAMAHQQCPETPFLFVSGTMGEETAMESLKMGATDFIIKDRLYRLVPAVERALKEAKRTAERRQMEETLRERDELFRQITENVDDLIAVLDLNGVRLFNSPSYQKLFGTAESLGGTDSFLEIHPADRERIERIFRQTVATGVGQRAQYRFLLKDGSVRSIESQGSVIRDKTGTISNVVVVSRDVTERNRADEQIREQAALLDKAQDAICLNDMEQRILYWNKSAENLYGWSAEEALGQDSNDLLFGSNSTRPLEAVKALIAKGEWQGELRQVTKDGRKIVVQSRWTLMRDQEDKPKSILIINTDVTEKKIIEQQFLRTQRMESIGALAGGIAHDLNNLLGPILMATELLDKEKITPYAEKMLQMVKINAERGCDMVRQILSFARGVSGEPQVTDIRNIIHEMVQLARHTFPRAIRIRTEIPDHLPLIMGDATQLHQVLLNLTVNARDAMPEGGSLELKAAAVFLRDRFTPMLEHPVTGPHVVLSVKDTGAGIPDALLDKIFEPFFTTKELGKGTGLGLSTALGIIKNHHGFVEVLSKVGHGTVFNIYLPVVAAQKPVVPLRGGPVLLMGQGERILLIDDEVAVLEITKETLETFNYRVSTAKEGAEAISIFEREHAEIKAVVTDMIMTPMDGPATVRALREIDPDVKVVCASTSSAEGAFREIQNLKVEAFLPKPYTPEDLLRILREVISAPGTETIPSSGPWVPSIPKGRSLGKVLEQTNSG